MAALRSFEQFVQRIMESPFTRLTRSRLQPVELAKRLEREMDATKRIGVGRIYVANDYSIGLSAVDYAGFESYRSSLQLELASFLKGRGKERGCTFVAPVTVVLHAVDEAKPGEVRVTAAILDLPDPPLGADTEPRHTRRFASIEGDVPLTRPATGPSALVILDEDGSSRTIVLRGSAVRLGRGLDNDIVLDGTSVSRVHAELSVQGDGSYLLKDLDSTNGTAVNGRRVRETVLHFGDVITLGAVEVRFDRGS